MNMEDKSVECTFFVKKRNRGFSIRSLLILVFQFLVLQVCAISLSLSSAFASESEPIHTKPIQTISLLSSSSPSNSIQKITIARGIGNYAPLEMIQKGKLTGLHIDLITYAASKLGIEVEFVPLPWGKALKAFSAGDIDAISYFGYTKERAEFAYYHAGNILSDTKWVLIALEERALEFNFDHSLTGLGDYIIGVQDGYSHGEYFDNKNELQREIVSDFKGLESNLKSKKHDLGMISYQEFLGFEEKGYFNGIVALTPEVDSDPQYIAFSRAKDAGGHLKSIAELFAKELELLKSSDEYKALLKRYNFYHYQ